MNMIKSEKQKSVVEKKDKGVVAIEQAKSKLRTLTVHSGIRAGLRGCSSGGCHTPSNHNETLVTL